jgi:hypothetical protein
MDRYFSMKKTEVQLEDLHITGIVCIFIASKYEDIYHLDMKCIYRKIGHQKFSVKKIVEIECEILKTIGFRLGTCTLIDFVESSLIKIEENSGRKNDIEFLKEVALHLGRMALHSYKLSEELPSHLAISLAYLTHYMIRNKLKKK